MRKLITPIIIAVTLLAAVFVGIAVASPPFQDILVPGGPRSGIVQLWRDFGTYQAPTVALAPFDDSTGGAIVVDHVHYEVHEGEMWHASHTNASVADDDYLNILFHVGGAVDAHMEWEVFAGGQVTVTLFAGVTVSNTGTALTAYNMNRTVTTTASSQIYHTPVITSTGNVLLVNNRVLPGGTSPTTRVGGGIRSGAEWILAPGLYYLIQVRNVSGGAIPINTVAEWYEEDAQ